MNTTVSFAYMTHTSILSVLCITYLTSKHLMIEKMCVVIYHITLN